MGERNTQRPPAMRPTSSARSALLGRRDLLARGGVLLAGAAAATLATPEEAAGSPQGGAAASPLSIGFVPRCPSGKAGAASTPARVTGGEHIASGDFPHGVEITIHGLISAPDISLGVVAHFPKGDGSGESWPMYAGQIGTVTRHAQPVTFTMPLDAGGGVNLSLVGGSAGQEAEVPLRLSASDTGNARLNTGTYFIAVTGSQRPNWSSYQVDTEHPGSGLLLSMMHRGQRTLVPAGLTQVVLSVRPAKRPA